MAVQAQYLASSTQAISAPVADTTVSAAVVNTTETVLMTKSLPASFFQVGMTLLLEIFGRHTSSGVAVTARFRVRYGGLTGTVLLDSNVMTPRASMTDAFFYLKALITCRSLGAAGTIFGQGFAQFGRSDANAIQVTQGLEGSGVTLKAKNAVVAIDTTVASDLVLTVEYSGNTAGNTVTVDTALILKSIL